MHEDILRNEIDKMKKEYDFSKRIAQRGSINLKSEVARLRIFCWTALAKRPVHAGEGGRGGVGGRPDMSHPRRD